MALRFNMSSGVFAGPDMTASVNVLTSIALTRTICPTGVNSIITSLPCIALFMGYYNLNSS